MVLMKPIRRPVADTAGFAVIAQITCHKLSLKQNHAKIQHVLNEFDIVLVLPILIYDPERFW